MKIELKDVTVRELCEGYKNNGEGGVVGFRGNLDIRPPYQREFIYNDKQRDAVIDTVMKNFPLNVLYWAVRDDDSYEVIDGQQRILSICQYISGDFSIDGLNFENLMPDQQKPILDYKLKVYFCSGDSSEKLEWFKTINIAGAKLTNQELRNAVYSGPWVADAKIYFSKRECVAHNIGRDYLRGSAIRQEYLETVIKWISGKKKINDIDVREYMAGHQYDPNASALWRYFQDIISWIEATFTKKRVKLMKGVDWGILYNKFKDEVYNTDKIEEEIKELILDEDVTKKRGIYPYVLTRDEKHLSIRAFPEAIKQAIYVKQGGKCKKCRKGFELSEMEADHITPWSKSGKTVKSNCQLLCKSCNRRKSAK
jgi:hypothetical protein